MANNNNSASRVHAILNRALAQNEDIAVYEAWCRASGVVDRTDDAGRVLRASEMVELMRAELVQVRHVMKTSPFSTDIYFHQIHHLLETVLNPQQLLAPWRNIRGNIGADSLLSLKVCADVLAHEEDEISEEQLNQLLADIEAIYAVLGRGEESQLPLALALFIGQQLDRIRRAISQYHVVGAKAIRSCARQAMLDAMDRREELPYSTELGMLGSLIEKAGTLADGAIKSTKAIEATQQLKALTGNIFKG